MKLVHNTPIKLKTDYRFRKSDDVITTIIDTKRRIQRTEKTETTYFIWFLSLKLLLEMEKLGLGLQKRKEVLIIGKDIKIDKNYYKEWDLNEVLKLPFHKWWKTHKNLFEVPLSVDIAETSSWTPKPHFRFLRVDTRNNYTNIKKGVLEGIEDLIGQKVDKVSQFPVTGQPRYDNEIITYNLLIRKLNGEDNESIFEIEKGRFKNIDKPDKGGNYYEKKGLDGKVKVLSESKLWGSYREYMKLTPKEREIQYAKVRKEDVFEREGGIYRTRRLKTEGLRIGSQFRSALTLEINRYMRNYQQILNGVAQGKYRKPVKF